MTIETFTQMYFPTEKEKQMDALGRFIKEQCGKDYTAILNVLFRNGIRSIKDLNDLEVSKILDFRHIGEKRKRSIIVAKRVIDEMLAD